MTTVALERPTAYTSGAVLSTGTIGTTGTDFFIKITHAQIRVRAPTAEVTGDGDQAPSFLPLLFAYFDCSLRGAMLASQAIGLAALVDAAKNPVSTDMKLHLGNTREIASRVVVQDIDINWQRTGEFVGVAMLLKGTCHATTGASTLAES